MQPAAIPANEQQRVDALRAYSILDTLPEKAYDDIVFIASTICNTPIALVSLIDSERQWFKARRGLDVEQTRRDIAFCSHAILDPEKLMIVDDATCDARFADNPLVLQSPKIRFYAGAPLVTAEGCALGTLCVIDTKPRQLSETQKEMLRGLSRQCIAQLELRRTVAQLEHRNTQLRSSRNELAKLCQMLEGQRDIIERDLQRAEVIQRSLLPEHAPDLDNCYLQTLYRPGHTIGGDFYDIIQVDSRKLALVIADAAGHGVSAAMLSVLFKLYLNGDCIGDDVKYRPGAALARINTAMLERRPAPGVFITAVYCLFDVQDQTLTVASAGHVPVICVRNDGAFDTIEHTGPALGLDTAATYEEGELRLQQGDRLLMYTDGLNELGDGAPPRVERIAKTLYGIGHDEAALQKLLTRIAAGLERSDRDDVTLVLLNFATGQNRFDETGASVALRTATADTINEITYAHTDQETFIRFVGRITWMYSQTLFDFVVSVIDSGREVILDFRNCALLDSTLLGTLHELVTRADSAGVRIRLQNNPPAQLEAFRELSMRQVLNCISDHPTPLPVAQQNLDLVELTPGQQQQRLLRAHEVLAELCEDSKAEFSGVIEALRAE